MAKATTKSAIRRLMKDQKELIQHPVQNVSAAPLDSNIFEWHCNIKQDDHIIYHVILFFPENYPYSSPSAEFVPTGLSYHGGAVKRGQKGDQICLNIFSDFGDVHTEWASERGAGWSPGYTAQTILLNVVSFLADSSNGKDLKYQRLCQSFECTDCGHTFSKPSPSLKVMDSEEMSEEDDVSSNYTQIVDYISKEKFDPNKTPSGDELFGYGLVLTKQGRKSNLTTPCEFLTSGTFYSMRSSTGVIHSIMKEELNLFLPLYINRIHGYKIRQEFQKLLRDVQSVLFPRDAKSKFKPSYADLVLQLIPNLMCSTVVEFSKGSVHTSDNSLQGYFALHRLFLWAMEVYPDLEKEIERRLESFVTNLDLRTKDCCPNIGQWLMLLSVSKTFTWKSVASAYLSESFRRNVMWYVKSDENLGSMKKSQKYRLEKTFELTKVSRNLLAFQVAFLKIAKPDNLSKDQILDRYEANLGFPSTDMVCEMKDACQKIQSEIKNFRDWYGVLGLTYPSDASLFETLKESVMYANTRKGYYFVPNVPNNSFNNSTSPNRIFTLVGHVSLILLLCFVIWASSSY